MSSQFLGKRKDTDPCRSLFAGESKRGPKETKEKEASDGKELGESKCGPEATKEEEASDGKVFDISAWMTSYSEWFLQAIENGELVEADVEEDDDEPCEICKENGHWQLYCPWKFELPPGPIPAGIPPKYRVECKGCHKGEFDEKTGDCANCDFLYKNVLLKTCHICWRFGHSDNTDKNCRHYGKEVTRDKDV